MIQKRTEMLERLSRQKQDDTIICYMIQVEPRFLAQPTGWMGSSASHQDQEHKMRDKVRQR